MIPRLAVVLVAACVLASGAIRPSAMGQTAAPQLPSSPMTFGAFVVRFSTDGTFMLEGQGWPSMPGTWRTRGSQIDLGISDRTAGCDEPGRYRFQVEGSPTEFRSRVRRLRAAADDLRPQHVAPDGEAEAIPARRIVRTAGARRAGAAQDATTSQRQLALVPRTAGFGRRRRPEPPRPLGRQDGREHSLAHADSGARAFQPDRLGQPHLRHQRHQQPTRKRLSGPACTATATRRRIARATAG